MPEQTAQQWLRAAATANAKNFPARMDLISKRVNLVGVPGIENIGYNEWAAQCKHEFEQGIFKERALRRL